MGFSKSLGCFREYQGVSRDQKASQRLSGLFEGFQGRLKRSQRFSRRFQGVSEVQRAFQGTSEVIQGPGDVLRDQHEFREDFKGSKGISGWFQVFQWVSQWSL